MMASAGSRFRFLAPSVRAALIVVGSAPLWTALLHDVPLASALTRPFDAWFAFQCHRELGRSLFLNGNPLPVCARCSGIYFGLGLGALVLRPRLSVVAARVWVGTAALIMVLDVLTEALAMRPEWAPLRLVTGLLLGYPVGVLLVNAVRDAGGRTAAA